MHGPAHRRSRSTAYIMASPEGRTTLYGSPDAVVVDGVLRYSRGDSLSGGIALRVAISLAARRPLPFVAVVLVVGPSGRESARDQLRRAPLLEPAAVEGGHLRPLVEIGLEDVEHPALRSDVGEGGAGFGVFLVPERRGEAASARLLVLGQQLASDRLGLVQAHPDERFGTVLELGAGVGHGCLQWGW